MRLTNKFNLPAPFVRAVTNDPYNKGESDYTATSLTNPPRAMALLEKFKDSGELETDVSDRVASIIGQGAHSVAERAARPGIDICEERFFDEFNVDGKRFIISGQVDLYETDSCAVYDWKTTKAYAFSKKAGGGKKIEWIVQLNVVAELLRENGQNPKALHIIALLKDWDKEKNQNHPDTEVVEVNIPMWPRKQTITYVEDRIRVHEAAKKDLPKCTEHWGGRRCRRWCDAVSVCTQAKDMFEKGIIE